MPYIQALTRLAIKIEPNPTQTISEELNCLAKTVQFHIKIQTLSYLIAITVAHAKRAQKTRPKNYQFHEKRPEQN